MKNESRQKLKHTVLNRITTEHVKPLPKIWFTSRECAVWFLWVLSVLVGALALAVILYVSAYKSTAFVEATHESVWWFYIEFLPYAWLLLFFFMSGLAYYNFRHTKSGYRYPLWQIIGSSLCLSVIGGIGLHAAGMGQVIDRELDIYMPMYTSQEQIELTLWQQPQAGRLVGQLQGILEAGSRVAIIDMEGTAWVLNIVELQALDEAELLRGHQVRILGVTSSTAQIFHACGVFPWMFGKAMSYQKLKAERTSFLERMQAHKEAATRLETLEEIAYADRDMGKCAGLPVVERVSEVIP